MSKRDQMITLVEEFNRSGLTQRAFCLQKQIIHSTFQYWYLKLKRQSQTSENFFSVDFNRDLDSGKIEVCYPNGTSVRMESFNLTHIRQLLSLGDV